MPKAATKSKSSNKVNNVDEFKRALRSLKIKVSDVLAHKEYADKIVIVTVGGQKFVWERGK